VLYILYGKYYGLTYEMAKAITSELFWEALRGMPAKRNEQTKSLKIALKGSSCDQNCPCACTIKKEIIFI
jgi:hypothetical protein